MKSRTALSAVSVCAVSVLLVPLAGCGDGSGREPSGGGAASAKVPGPPGERKAPKPGKGSKDPDDINGDGYRDLLVPVLVGKGHQAASDQRVAVVYGSAEGIDPATRTVLGRGELGLPESEPSDVTTATGVAAADVVTADLDGDGFPDFVTPVAGARVSDGRISAQRAVPYVTWGSPEGPRGRATPLTLPQGAAKLGVESVVRGDFDGDGHHDLAALARNRSSTVVLYGPFTRAGAPARSSTELPGHDGTLIADAIDPTGKPRATSLLVQHINDGEQSANTLYPAREGTQLAGKGRELRPGNAHAFGDFDGDGKRDVAIGDDGGRNNEPNADTEAPDVAGSLGVYPGSGGAPVTHKLPVPKGRTTSYGPGGFVAADPDGDGRDGILVATYEGATFLDGDQRTEVLREGPAEVDGKKTKSRRARPASAGDFDGDGKDELVLNWSPDSLFGLYGENPTYWWITKGLSADDRAAFHTVGLTGDSGQG